MNKNLPIIFVIPEILENCLLFLDPNSLQTVSRVNKFTSNIFKVSNQNFWKQKVIKDFKNVKLDCKYWKKMYIKLQMKLITLNFRWNLKSGYPIKIQNMVYIDNVKKNNIRNVIKSIVKIDNIWNLTPYEQLNINCHDEYPDLKCSLKLKSVKKSPKVHSGVILKIKLLDIDFVNFKINISVLGSDPKRIDFYKKHIKDKIYPIYTSTVFNNNIQQRDELIFTVVSEMDIDYDNIIDEMNDVLY